MPNPPPSDRAVLTTEMRLAGTRGARSVDVVASTDALDAHGTVLDSSSWRLERFVRNPVVLYAHNQRELPIGRATDVRVVDGALRATLHFVTAAANPLAEQVWQLVQQDALRAVSVGFFSGDVTTQKRDGRDVAVLTDNELLEISVVPVPSNPEAVATMRARALALSPSPSPHEESMTDTKPEAVEADPIQSPLAQAEAVTRAQTLPADALALKCARAEVEVARLHAKLEGTEAQLTAARVDLAQHATVAPDLERALVDARAEIATLQAQVVAFERASLLADARAAHKLSPAHLDPATPRGEFLASLSVAQLRAYLESKGREIPLAEARPPRPLRAKAWHEMAPAEKARLYQHDRATYDALKTAAGE